MTIGLAAAAGVALVSLVITIVLMLRLRRLRRHYAVLRGKAKDQDLIGLVSDWSGQLAAMNHRVDGVVASQQEIETISKFALQKFAMVRYDAFEDMGGRLSFSAALLDAFGDGMIISSINGRTETRTYAKSIKALSSDHNLSDEEQRAVAEAMSGTGRGESQTVAR